jgi:hypothetical protein
MLYCKRGIVMRLASPRFLHGNNKQGFPQAASEIAFLRHFLNGLP